MNLWINIDEASFYRTLSFKSEKSLSTCEDHAVKFGELKNPTKTGDQRTKFDEMFRLSHVLVVSEVLSSSGISFSSCSFLSVASISSNTGISSLAVGSPLIPPVRLRRAIYTGISQPFSSVPWPWDIVATRICLRIPWHSWIDFVFISTPRHRK